MSTFKNVKIVLKYSKSSFNIQLQVMMSSTITYVSIRAACVKQETNEENAENRRKLNMGGGRGIGRRRLGESQKKMPTFYHGKYILL